MDPKNFKSTKLRAQTIDELEVALNQLRSELASLRVNQVSSGVAAKLAKIKTVRKAIARTLTILNEKKRANVKSAFSSKAKLAEFNQKNGTNFSFNRKPRELLPRLTRAQRQALTKHQKNARTQKHRTRQHNFPQRVYAVTA